MNEILWQEVIVTWANALKLWDVMILEISDLLDGSFFISLLKEMGQDIVINENVRHVDVVKKFIEENYKMIKLKDSWDNGEVTLVGSLLLLTSFLEVSHLRSPLFSLNTNIQLEIQAFIQKCLPIPKNSITRLNIYDAIDNIEQPGDVYQQSSEEPSSFVSSPNSSYTACCPSPSIKSVVKNKVKYLQNQVEVLNLDKQHLHEELETSKQDYLELNIKYKGKEQEVLHLKNELFLTKNNMMAEASDNVQLKNNEIEQIKDDLTLLQVALSFTRTELDTVIQENKFLQDELITEKQQKNKLKQNLLESEMKLSGLTASVEQLEFKLTLMKQTCQEQEDMLRECGRTKILDETVATGNDESVITTVLPGGETLASVIDLKYAELEEETKKLKESLASSEAKVLDLEEALSRQIKNKIEESPDVSRYYLTNERNEIDHLHGILDAKTIRLEESATLSERLRRDLNERENELKSVRSSLKHAVSETDHLKICLTIKQTEIVDLQSQLEFCEGKLIQRDDRICSLTVDIGERVCEAEQLREKLSNCEQQLILVQGNLKKKETELNEIKIDLKSYKNEQESLKNELCAKASTVAELKHDVQMCEHEKIVLEKKFDYLLKDLEKNESLKKDLNACKEVNNHLGKELNECKEINSRLEKELNIERANLKTVQDQVDLEDKLNNAFDFKLTELQTKMKVQYEKELSTAIDEYTDKINQMKLKITKDKLHIQELSSDLWNTTDKLLLSQQQAEALRNQLRRTKCALEILSNSSGRRHSLATTAAIQRASNPCLWLQSEDGDSLPVEIFNEPLTVVRRKAATVVWPSLNNITDSSPYTRRTSRFSMVMESSGASQEEEEDEEIFNDAFLQDLKDGICRLPSEENKLERASCPPIAANKLPPDSPMHMEKVSDKQVLLPPEKPKRKGQIAYSKPGPPTPSRSACLRLSLQNFEKPSAHRKFLRENINPETLPPPSAGPSRFSKLFATAKGQNKTKPMGSPKVKRKSFFQRKFGSNRENFPPA